MPMSICILLMKIWSINNCYILYTRIHTALSPGRCRSTKHSLEVVSHGIDSCCRRWGQARSRRHRLSSFRRVFGSKEERRNEEQEPNEDSDDDACDLTARELATAGVGALRGAHGREIPVRLATLLVGRARIQCVFLRGAESDLVVVVVVDAIYACNISGGGSSEDGSAIDPTLLALPHHALGEAPSRPGGRDEALTTRHCHHQALVVRSVVVRARVLLSPARTVGGLIDVSPRSIHTHGVSSSRRSAHVGGTKYGGPLGKQIIGGSDGSSGVVEAQFFGTHRSIGQGSAGNHHGWPSRAHFAVASLERDISSRQVVIGILDIHEANHGTIIERKSVGREGDNINLARVNRPLEVPEALSCARNIIGFAVRPEPEAMITLIPLERVARATWVEIIGQCSLGNAQNHGRRHSDNNWGQQ